uniref:Uncharacterized protein n=1 Tax=Meloidogyne enterolobii TaxID=390850 RepID=A0A6V7TWZ7_MELEN|nr:unnamed protein product [Meloidogyne enterolobii]
MELKYPFYASKHRDNHASPPYPKAAECLKFLPGEIEEHPNFFGATHLPEQTEP